MALVRFKSKYGATQVADSNTASGYDLLPVGTMMYWAGPTASIPAGWLICDGSAVNRLTYSNLHAHMAFISYPYGSGDGSTTFNIPDARGRALRHGTSPVSSGAETYTLADADVVAHSHTVNHSHGLTSHTHAGSDHSHPGVSHGHAAVPHNHGASTPGGGLHEHSYFVQNNVNPGTTYLRTSTNAPAPGGLTVHASGGGNHDHNFAASAGPSIASVGTQIEIFSNSPASTTTTQSADASTGEASSTVTAINGGSARSSISLMQPFVVLNVIIKA